MAEAALEPGRLSPVFSRKENDRPGKMEGLNPERARRLLLPRSPSMPHHNSVGPRKTGSNTVALGKPAAQKPTSIKQECSPSPNGEARLPLVRIPKPVLSMIAGVKRPRNHLNEPQEPYPHPRRQWCSSPPVFPPRK